MNKHLLKTLLLTATLIFTSLGVSFAEPKKGGTLIAAVGNSPRHLNPAVQSGIVTGFPGAQLFATPIRYDNNWEPQPYLAESWDCLLYTSPSPRDGRISRMPSSA